MYIETRIGNSKTSVVHTVRDGQVIQLNGVYCKRVNTRSTALEQYKTHLVFITLRLRLCAIKVNISMSHNRIILNLS